MAGDIIGLTDKKQATSITGVGGNKPTEITGERSSIFFNENLDGAPRQDDLFAIRILGQTTQIQWLKDIIKNQVASTDFHVIPQTEDRELSDAEQKAADNIENFLHGNFNTDNQSFDDLLKILLDDILDFNSGVVELVADNNGDLDQIITRDGLTFTKNVREKGLLPPEDSDEPAYYQFSLASHAQQFFDRNRQGIDIREITDEISGLPFSRVFNREQKEFSRSQIVWFSESPVSYDPYGFGRTQKVKKAAEVMINGDHHRNKFFLENEFHKGFLNVPDETSQQQLKQLKKRFSDSAGNEHELPIIGAENADYVNIDPEPEKMQFLESQKWYSKMVIMAYGLNEAEAGLHENANLSVSEEMKNNIWRRTTNPLLEMIQRRFNNQIIPKMAEAKAFDVDFKFEFKPANRFIEKMENEIIDQELQNGTITLNEARERKGKEPFGDIGDAPQTAFEEFARNNPSFVIEQLTELEDVPSGDGGPGGGLFQSFLNNDDNEDDGDSKNASGSTGNNSEKKEERERETLDVNDYREAFKHKDEVLEHTKDALRNERGFNDVPGIVQHKEEMKDDVAEIFNSVNLEQEMRQELPEEEREDGHTLVDADSILDSINIRERLGSVLETNNLGALEMSAEHNEEEIEEETEKRLTIPSETKVEISFDVMDTFTADIIREQALSSATQIEDSIKSRLKNEILEGAEEGEGIPQITERIQNVKNDISEDHAELVARTETLQSSRKGSQALAESTDLVGGKEWLATDDTRTRAWHNAMDGTVVPKDEQFTVPKVSDSDQPDNYPRTARVVGEDQPFNCRCAQAPVLAEDMPDNPMQLEADFEGVNVELGISKRQYEVWKEHGQDFDSFEKFWKTVNKQKSKTEIAKEFNMSKTTVYNWSD